MSKDTDPTTAVVEATDSPVANAPKKDKKRKDKKESKKRPAEDATVSNEVKKAKKDGAEEKKERKKSKKEKKTESEEKENGEEEEKKVKKVKKDKKKKVESEGVKDAMEVDQVKEVPAAVTTKPSKKEAKKASKSNSSSGTWSYSEDPSLTALPESTITEFYNSNQVQVHPSATSPTPLRPILEFSQANLPAHLAKPLSAFPKPTVIQSACWPYILDGQDMIGIAATGSGKTVAFGIPALIHVANRIAAGDVKRFKPQVLMLSPTRELAMQIQEQMEKYSGKDLKSVVIYGGVSKYDQKALLRSGSGAHILVATPGRLLDLVEEDSSACDLSDVSYLVLDEADRMLDQGFEEAIKKIVARLTRKSRQNVMFSATWPTAIQKIANQYLNSATKVTVGSLDLSANINIEQRVEVVDQRSKEAKLLELLKKYHNKARTNRILIFALYKKEAARIEQFVRRQGYNIAAIHGDLSQDQRTRAIEGFRSGTVPLLVATDVAARGIDIPNVEYVINVTFPLTVEDYCHRIGRTGRAGAKGVSHTLFTVLDKAHSGALINVLKDAGQPVPDELLKFGTTVKKKVDPNYGAFAKDVDMSQKGTKIKFSNDSDSD